MAKRKIEAPQDSDIKNAAETSDFKQSLVDTLQESNTARNEMKEVLHEILRHPETISEVKAIIDKIDRDSVKAFWSKFGFTVWSVIVFITGVGATILIENFLKK